MAKPAVIFVVALGVSLAYLIFAIRKLGIWGGVLLLAIWMAVFLFSRAKSRGV